jgi:hypothetical protein
MVAAALQVAIPHGERERLEEEDGDACCWMHVQQLN